MNSGQILVGPIAPIIGAIVGGLISLGVTYFFVLKRKSITFWVTPTENLTRTLQGHNRQITVSVDGQAFLNLNRATIRVKNTGSSSLEGVKFQIGIPGNHSGYLANIAGADPEVWKAIDISMADPHAQFNPTFNIALSSFLNAREAFVIQVFFDGTADKCTVRCRLPDVKAKFRAGEPLAWRDIPKLGMVLIGFMQLLVIGLAAVLGFGVELFHRFVK